MVKKIEISDVINKSIFFIGAGFSYGTGCLTSDQMFRRLKEMSLDEASDEFSKTEKEAIKFLISCLRYHAEWRSLQQGKGIDIQPNIEELALLIRRIKNRETFLPYPITGNWADKLIQLESAFLEERDDDINEGLFEHLDRKLKTLLKHQWLEIDSELKYLDPLLGFLKETTSEDYFFDFFSLNNDLVLEEYFGTNGEKPWRGFVQGKWRAVKRDKKNDDYGRINLHKLHGSIDWLRLVDSDIYEEEYLSEESGLDEKVKDELNDSIDENHNPYIIFGQGTKTFSVEPFFSLINYFNSILNSDEKQYVFVIGYSFFDPYVNNLLFSSIKDFKRLIIVNPFFGPEEINGVDELKTGSENFFRINYPEGLNKSLISNYLRDIQQNAFYSELPEFNYLNVSAENIEYLPLTTEEFLNEFFKNKGELLHQLISTYEDEKDKESPF